MLREKLSRLNTKAQENIAANRVVKAFAREDYEKEDFDKYNKDYCEHNQQAAMVWLTFQPYIETLAQALWAVQMLVGGIFVINGRITIAQYTVFSGLLWTIANAMRNIGMLINDLQRFFASISKIIEVYYSRPNIVNNHNSAERPRLKGDIEFKNVSAKFGDITVLHNIDLNIKHGETIVIMGSTGSGKTTLMNLIARFYDVSEGGVYVWVKEAFGEFWGFQAGWWGTVSTYITNGVYVALVAGYVSQMIPMSDIAVEAIKIGMILIFTIVNLMGLREVGKVSTILSVLIIRIRAGCGSGTYQLADKPYGTYAS